MFVGTLRDGDKIGCHMSAPEKDVSIMIEKWEDEDGWRVVVYIDGVVSEVSPPDTRKVARQQAEVVAKKFETQFGNWRRVYALR